MAKIKPISHFERCNNPTPPDTSFPVMDKEEVVVKQLVDENTGRMYQTLEKRKVDFNRLSHLKVNDFSMENLQCAGAPLSPCKLSADVHTNINIVESSLENISKSLNK